MNDLRTAAQQALEALKDDQYRLVEVSPNQYEYKTDLAIAALERALAQQAEPVEPYCYVYEYDGAFGLHREFYPKVYNGHKPDRTVPVYTSPPQRKPLTEEKKRALADKFLSCQPESYEVSGVFDLISAVERAHGIKE